MPGDLPAQLAFRTGASIARPAISEVLTAFHARISAVLEDVGLHCDVV
jgi:hypothetical protein